MVDTALPSDRQVIRRRYRVERLLHRDSIRALLEAEGAYAAYARAQLAPPLFARSEWWSATSSAGRATVVHSRGGLGPALVTIGDPTALDALLGLHPGARTCFAAFRPEHLQAMRRRFLLTRREMMVRMSVTEEAFRPVPGDAVRLHGRDIATINRLYSSEGGPAAYSFRHIEDGVYYGVIVEGRLVSIAGTHVDSPSEKVAVIGNVFTHPHYRGKGYAAIATTAVTQALLEHCDLVALTVEVRNKPGVAVYDRLGFQEECTLYETPAIRKDALGLASWARRLTAAWRGRHEGKEIALQ